MATKYIVVREPKAGTGQPEEILGEFDRSDDADARAAQESQNEENLGFNVFVHVRRED